MNSLELISYRIPRSDSRPLADSNQDTRIQRSALLPPVKFEPILSFTKLGDLDSNQDTELQRLMSYR